MKLVNILPLLDLGRLLNLKILFIKLIESILSFNQKCNVCNNVNCKIKI